MTYLLDTNVISETRKARRDANVMAWFNSVPSSSLYLSVLVTGEIRRGIESIRPRDPRQAAALERWLDSFSIEFADRILPVTSEIADEWGRMSVPNRLPTADGLIAATAKVHRLTLVTRDTGDLAQRGVVIFNPFEPIH